MVDKVIFLMYVRCFTGKTSIYNILGEILGRGYTLVHAYRRKNMI